MRRGGFASRIGRVNARPSARLDGKIEPVVWYCSRNWPKNARHSAQYRMIGLTWTQGCLVDEGAGNIAFFSGGTTGSDEGCEDGGAVEDGEFDTQECLDAVGTTC